MKPHNEHKLADLLRGIKERSEYENLLIKGICINSADVEAGFLFIAMGNGNNYINDAVNRGAAAIVSDQPGTAGNTPYLHIADIAVYLVDILERFYAIQEAPVKLYGITGTNGKTSCAHFLAEAISSQERCGVIGTLGYGEFGNLTYNGYTTPDISSVYRIISEFRNQGIHAVVMEVSSHALDQERVAGLQFASAIFTNLSQDHLDYHSSMNDYFRAKSRLFKDFKIQNAVINIDDDYGRELVSQYGDGRYSMIVYGCAISHHEHKFVSAENIKSTRNGMEFNINSSWGQMKIATGIYGEFNVYNLLATIAVLLNDGVKIDTVRELIEKINPVKGRLEKISAKGYPDVFVDFAHTPDALEKAIVALKQAYRSNITCVFGCGGDRDKSKRPLMGAIASKYCQLIFVTDDNPRTEDPSSIVQDILAGVDHSKNVTVIHSRRNAIETAINSSANEDVVLIAGKGHETTQIIGKDKFEFNDAKVVTEVIAA